MKIFCIGSNKTGTTSLSRVLSVFGYNVAPINPVFVEQTSILTDYLNGNYQKLERLINTYDAFKDRPWNHKDFYRYLDLKYKDSKFILTTRDSGSWVKSYKSFAEKISLKKRWFYKMVSIDCYGVEDFLSHEDVMIDCYENRNASIKEYFLNRHHDYISLDLCDDNKMIRLCNFLKLPLVEYKYPHLNRSVSGSLF